MSNLQVGHDINAKVRTADVSLEKNVSFKDLFLSEKVLSGLNKSGFYRPSPIQLNAIPSGRCGLDLIVQAKSGTGKTCVFSVIALEAIVTSTSALQTIILAPTREIAVQISGVLEAIGQCMKDLVVTCFIGGRPVSEDKANSRGCHIAVGTPGRMFQLLQLGILSCENVRLFVLDEADKLLEHNFQAQINSIYSILPVNKQMIAASATYPEELAQFVTKYMQDPTFVRLNPKDMALLGIKQYIHEIPHPLDKYLSDFEHKIKATVNLLEAYTFTQALVFSNYHSHAKDLSDACNSVGLSATFISGNLAQTKRFEAIQLLKDYKCKILISTDLTSRGIDASNVDLVVNLDVPHDWETYMHRTGRAGRFGSLGAVISVVLAGSETAELLKITESCNIPIYPIACVDGNISLSTQSMNISNGPLQKEETLHHLESIIGNRETDDDKHLEPNHTEIKDTPIDASMTMDANKYTPNLRLPTTPSLSELMIRMDTKEYAQRLRLRTIGLPSMRELMCNMDAKEYAQRLRLRKIPSLPELMFKYKARSKPPCFSYNALLENFSFYKNHGKLKELDQIMISNETTTKDDVDNGDKQDSDTMASVSQKFYTQCTTIVSDNDDTYQDVVSQGKSEANSSTCSAREVLTPSRSCVTGACCNQAGAKLKSASPKASWNAKKIPKSSREEPLTSCDGEGYVRYPKTSGKKPSDARRDRTIPLNKGKRASRKGRHRRAHAQDFAPMLLPRYSNSEKSLQKNFHCASCITYGKQSFWKWHSYHNFMYWMWFNQYLYLQSSR